MKLLISQTKENHACYWHFENNRVSPLDLQQFQTHDLFQDEHQIKPVSLPFELVMLITKNLFKMYIDTYNFAEACNLCFVNKEFAKVIYMNIYGPGKIKHVDIMKRLSRTFRLLELIYDEYLTVPNLGAFTKVGFVMTRNGTKVGNRHYHPWDFFLDETSLEEIILPDLVPSFMEFHGANHSDTSWVHGTELNGVIDATAIENPVICFILQDYNDTLIPKESTIEENDSFVKFAKLLRVCFGYRTAAYFMVKNDNERRNPFLHRSSTIMSL